MLTRIVRRGISFLILFASLLLGFAVPVAGLPVQSTRTYDNGTKSKVSLERFGAGFSQLNLTVNRSNINWGSTMKSVATQKIPRVALLIESSRTYGRGILRGIARFAHIHGPWSFFTLERDLHGGVPPILTTWKGDGIIARIENRVMAAKLRKLGCPVIDVLGQAALPGVPSFDTDAEAVAQMAVNFFLKAGFRHFAYVGYPGIPFSDKRRAAFARFLQEHGHSLRVMPHAPAGAVGSFGWPRCFARPL